MIGPQCITCTEATGMPGEPYAHIHKRGGEMIHLPGWDSQLPIFMVFENPDACNLVEEDEVISIGEWSPFATSRYSDACDYVMQCMFEENTLLAPGDRFWFEPGPHTAHCHTARCTADPVLRVCFVRFVMKRGCL